MKGLFITGTDTGVGKTRVAVGLTLAWRRRGRQVAAMKPVETGCTAIHDLDGDAALLAAASASPHPPRLLSPYRFRTPASPLHAAEIEHQPFPDLTAIVAAAGAIGHNADALLVEGAGGLLVPLAPGFFIADLAAALELPLLIVAPTRLGTINHTLLTIEAIRRRDLPLLGIVFNHLTANQGIEESRVPDMIARLTNVRYFGTLAYSSGACSIPPLPQNAQETLDPEAIWEAL